MCFGTSFWPILVPSVCEGARLARLGEDQVFKSKIQILIPLIEFITAQKLSFISKLPRFSRNFKLWANLAENSNSYVFETIYGFCLSLWVDANSNFQISRIHENFSLEPILGPKVTVETLSPGSEKLKISKCFVSDKTSEEYCLCLVWT